jgi:hypothetical protein
MSILDTITDPLGTRYKKKSMSERLGISAIKRKLTKTFIQPFSRLSPSYQWKNLKRRVKSRLGYYSEPAKAYRKGNMTQAILRRMTNSDTSNCVMPFRESYDLKSDPFDRDQTGPTGKGMFKKLAAYAAPGAMMGLVYASRKMKLYDKLRGKLAPPPPPPTPESRIRRAMNAVNRGGQHIKGKLAQKAAAAKAWVKGVAKDEIETAKLAGGLGAQSAWNTAKKKVEQVTAPYTKRFKVLMGKSKLSVDHSAKRRSKKTGSGRVKSQIHTTKASEDDISKLVMPFRESDYYIPRQQFNNQPPKRKGGLIDGLVTLGAVGAAGIGGMHVLNKLSNQKQLAINAEKAYMRLKSLRKQTKGTTHSMNPIMQAKTAWAGMKYDFHSGLASGAGMFRHKDVIRDANRAAMDVRASSYIKKWAKTRAKGPDGVVTQVMPYLRKSGASGIRKMIRSYTRKGKRRSEIYKLAKQKYGETFPKVVPKSSPTKEG